MKDSLVWNPGRLAAYGERIAWRIAETKEGATYREFARRICARMEKLPEGGVLASHAPNSVEHLELLLAGLFAGKTILPILHRWPEEEARRLAGKFGADSFWMPGEKVPEPLAARQSASLRGGRGTLLLTSGSSGEPKAVRHELGCHLRAAEASQVLLPVDGETRWLLDLPLAHVSGLSVVFRCLRHGGTLLFPGGKDGFRGEDGATHLSVVAPQLARMLEADYDFSSIRAVLAGGGPFPAPLLKQALERGLPVFLTYGMTETASQICTRRMDAQMDLPEPALGCGMPLPGWEVRADADGGLSVRGEALAAGYWDAEEGLKPLRDAEGWFATGDAGGYSARDGWRIEGRKDRMFISGGENIHPEQIERVLMCVPGVRRAWVVGRPDARYGRRPVAFVAGVFEEEAMRRILRGKLPGFAVPDEFLPWPSGIEPGKAKLRDADFADFASREGSRLSEGRDSILRRGWVSR